MCDDSHHQRQTNRQLEMLRTVYYVTVTSLLPKSGQENERARSPEMFRRNTAQLSSHVLLTATNHKLAQELQ